MARPSRNWSVIDRGSGVWYYKLRGWRSYKSTGIQIRYNQRKQPTNRHEAEIYASREADKLALIRDSGPTLAMFLEPYYTEECPHCERMATDGRPLTDRYRKDQRSRIEQLVLTDPISDVPMRQLNPGHIEKWKARMVNAGTGIRTINAALTALSGAFSEALHRGDLAYNPAKSVSSIRQGETEQFGIFTPEELRRMFVDEPVKAWGYDIQRKGLNHLPARAFGLLVATIGERPSAIMRLEWRHLQGEWLQFPQVKDRRKNRRVVPLTQIAQDALEELREDMVRVGPEDPIFGYDAGGRRGKTWFLKRFNHMMDALELSRQDPYGGRRVPYSLKYTLETELIDRGANPALVRDLMGHSHQRGEPDTILTPVQSRYRRKRADRIKELVPLIEDVVAGHHPRLHQVDSR